MKMGMKMVVVMVVRVESPAAWLPCLLPGSPHQQQNGLFVLESR